MDKTIYLGIGIIILLGIYIYLFKPHVVYTRFGAFQMEPFKANSNQLTNAPMDFSYLVDPNYARNILAAYYLNDDTKVKGLPVITHPLIYPSKAANDEYKYGLLWKDTNKSNTIYKNTHVRL